MNYKSKDIIDLRNKIIAHSDYVSARLEIIEYKGAASEQVADVIQSIGEFINSLNAFLRLGHVKYIGNADALDFVNELEEWSAIKGVKI